MENGVLIQQAYQAGKDAALLTVQEAFDEVLVGGPSPDVQEALLRLLTEIVKRMQTQPIHRAVQPEEARPWD